MHRKPSLPAIPTLYNGTRYRSRLEARWAAFFDALQWEHHYEPADLHGYIPDFLITRGLDSPEPLLIECKPFVQLDQDATAVANKVDAGGWLGDALIVGSVHWPSHVRTLSPTLVGDAFEPLIERGPDVHTYTIGRMRKEGGRWTDAYLAHAAPVVEPREADDCTGYWYPSVMPYELSPSEYMFVTMAWASAGNKTQWARK